MKLTCWSGLFEQTEHTVSAALQTIPRMAQPRLSPKRGNLRDNTIMKFKFFLTAFALFQLSTPSFSGTSVCPAIEFAELQTYTNEELRALSDDYSRRGFELGVPFHEFQNCIDQIKRISKITSARKRATEEQGTASQPQKSNGRELNAN